MDKKEIIKKLIEHTKEDFLSYFEDKSIQVKASEILEMALTGNSLLFSKRDELDSIIPDTEDDGSFACSYALNTGIMILNLIDFELTGDDKFYNNTITLFFDTVDFKVHEDLEQKYVTNPTESEIIKHDIFIREKKWFDNLFNN